MTNTAKQETFDDLNEVSSGMERPTLQALQDAQDKILNEIYAIKEAVRVLEEGGAASAVHIRRAVNRAEDSLHLAWSDLMIARIAEGVKE